MRFTRGTQRLTLFDIYSEGINRLTNLDLPVKKIHSPTGAGGGGGGGQNVNSNNLKFSNIRESCFFRFRMAKYVIRNTKKNRLAFS